MSSVWTAAARPRPLAVLRTPPPPVVRPRLALPPPVSLIPRRLPIPLLEDLRDVVSPPVSSSLWNWPSLHSPIWSLRLLSWSLICCRRDHRKRPAAAAPAAAAAAAIGRSRTSSVTPQSLLRLLRLLRPRLLFF